MRKIILIGMVALIFLIAGWLSSNALATLKERPLSIGAPAIRAGPQNHLQEKDIHVYDNKVIIDVQDVSWASYTDTHSMEPVLNADSNGIELKPKSPETLAVGDIVSYRSKYMPGLIVHRIIKISHDNKGWYAILKGDNNPTADPGKVRFDQINGVVIGVLY